MRVAALYDIHGNLPALEAVLGEVEEARPDLIVVGGDVAFGPMPSQVLELVQSLGERVIFIRGNADRVLDFSAKDAGDREVALWVAERLSEEQLAFLGRLPLDAVLDVDGLGKVRFCHGAPGSDEAMITGLTPEERLLRLLEGVDEPVVVCGHTHMQFDRRMKETRVVNAGSVGKPYEAEPGAYWLLAGPDISLLRTAYDVVAAARRIRATGYPNADQIASGIALRDRSLPERRAAFIEGLDQA